MQTRNSAPAKVYPRRTFCIAEEYDEALAEVACHGWSVADRYRIHSLSVSVDHTSEPRHVLHSGPLGSVTRHVDLVRDELIPPLLGVLAIIITPPRTYRLTVHLKATWSVSPTVSRSAAS